eukprot:426806_1
MCCYFLCLCLICTVKSSLVWHEGAGSVYLAWKYGTFIGKTGSSIWILGGSAGVQFGADMIEFNTSDGSYVKHNNSFNFKSTIGQGSVQNDDLLYMMEQIDKPVHPLNININVFNLTSLRITDTIIGYNNIATAYSGQCLLYYKQLLLIIGGMIGTFYDVDNITFSNEFIIYNIETKKWSKSTPIPITVGYTSCNIVDNVLYLIGGEQFQYIYNTPVYFNLFNSVRTMDISGLPDVDSNWNIMTTTLSAKRADHRSVVVEHMIYVVGGSRGGNVDIMTTVDIIDTIQQQIYFDSNLVYPKAQMSLISVNGKLYSFCGLPYGDDQNTGMIQYALLPQTTVTTQLPSSLLPSSTISSSSSTTPSAIQTTPTTEIPTTPSAISTTEISNNPSSQTVTFTTLIISENVQARADLEATFHIFLYLLVSFFIIISM